MPNEIFYTSDRLPEINAVIELYNAAGLPRPTDDKQRMEKMYEHSNLIVTAWHDELLVGVSRCVTDFAWSCYLADLAVHPQYKKQGIGKKLVELTKEILGEQSMILLLSVPTAMTYYPKIGFAKEDRAFTIYRSE